MTSLIQGVRPRVERACAEVRDVTTVDGATLRTFRYGNDQTLPTVVLVHGWGADHTIWEHIIESLCGEGLNVVALDQREHGASTAGRNRQAIDQLGYDLAAVLFELKLTKVIFVGHSGGGYAVQSFLRQHDLRTAFDIVGAVLVGTASHGQAVPVPERILMGSRFFQVALGSKRLGTKALRHTLGPTYEDASLEVVRRLFTATDRRARRAAFSSTTQMDLRAGLSGATLEVRVLAGKHDRVVAPEYGRELASFLPNAFFELVEAGHMLPLERPDRILEHILDLASNARR